MRRGILAPLLVLTALSLVCLIVRPSRASGIIVNNADSVRNPAFTSSTTLNTVASATTPRMVAQSSNGLRAHTLDQVPYALQALLSAVSTRLVIGNSNALRAFDLARPTEIIRTHLKYAIYVPLLEN